MELINVGFGNMVAADRIVSIVDIDSAPIKRAVTLARENGTLIDATQGRKTKSVIFMDSDHIVLSYLTIEKLEQNRVE